MFNKDKVAIDISSDRISIVIGTNKKIRKAAILETPRGAYIDDRIENIDSLTNPIKEYLNQIKIKSKYICFNIKGQDLITRHNTLPLLKEEAMLEAIQWELREFLGDRIEEYYYNYEILKEIEENKAKNLEIIMAAAEKSKIDSYIELGENLGFTNVLLDTYATVGARVLKNSKVYNDKTDLIGLITLNSQSSSFHIVSYEKLEIEKFQSLGVLGNNNEEINSLQDYINYLNKIDLSEEERINEESANTEKVVNAISTYFNSIVQFYSVGKIKKSLDKIFIVGTGTFINGITETFKKSFNSDITKIEDIQILKSSVKVPRNFKFQEHFYSYGLLLNDLNEDLNLYPRSITKINANTKIKKVYIATTIFFVLLLLGIFGYFKGEEIYLNSVKQNLTDKISEKQESIDKLSVIEEDINIYNSHIERVKSLNKSKDKKTDDLIADIQELIPGEVTVNTFSISNDNITISGVGNYDKITEFWANLREDERFKNSHIATITKGESGYSFTLEILVQGRES